MTEQVSKDETSILYDPGRRCIEINTHDGITLTVPISLSPSCIEMLVTGNPLAEKNGSEATNTF